jgi:hypothetical protein
VNEKTFPHLPEVVAEVDDQGARFYLRTHGVEPDLYLTADGHLRKAWLPLRTSADCAELARRLRAAADVLAPQAVSA